MSATSSNQRKKLGLKIGLNARGEGVTDLSTRKPAVASAFGDANDSDDDDESSDNNVHQNLVGRAAVNYSISKQQAIIRSQVDAAMASTDASIYDYDGAYDSFHSSDQNKQIDDPLESSDSNRKSRYIDDLMKSAKLRKVDRDIAYERKVSRDQKAEEEEQPEYRNKDRFITSSYKRQLDERHRHQEQDLLRQKQEEENDVTKRTDGLGIASFYGNMTKNVLTDTNQFDETRPSFNDAEDTGKSSSRESLDDAKRRNGNDDDNKNVDRFVLNQSKTATPLASVKDFNEQRMKIRFQREEKVKAARARYFQRHGIAVTFE
jgi:coiled-coil domain-containing protein 55